jgi:predicted RNase H-like HicB family nuclease
VLTKYIQAAMRRAKYEILGDDGSYYGEIPELPGVWANAGTLESCRDELAEVVEEWIVLGLKLRHRLPVLDNIDFNAAVEVA